MKYIFFIFFVVFFSCFCFAGSELETADHKINKNYNEKNQYMNSNSGLLIDVNTKEGRMLTDQLSLNNLEKGYSNCKIATENLKKNKVDQAQVKMSIWNKCLERYNTEKESLIKKIQDEK